MSNQIFCKVNKEMCDAVKAIAGDRIVVDCGAGRGLDGKSFREELDAYVYANHYDEHTDDVYTGQRVNYYEKAKKILKELKTEK